jgi:ABC-type transport system involved in cytochrome c biogenesis permease component
MLVSSVVVPVKIPVLKISIYIITSITAHPVRLAAILAIMSVSTFKTAVILYKAYHFKITD